MVEMGGRTFLFCLVSVAMIHTAPSYTNVPTIQDREFWYAEAEKDLIKRLQDVRDHKPVARSVIMFIGDGMSLSTVTAARELRRQRNSIRRQEGTDTESMQGLIWDHFPAAALAQTYNLNAQTGESSACATALLCGVKTNYETLGLDGRASFENCSSSLGARVSSILEWAQDAGKWTGIVTTTRITHATPAALFANAASRYWEDDSKIPPASRKTCKDIALQLVDNHPGKNINVLLGGGRRHWLPTVAKDPEEPSLEGRRLDGRNLIEDWLRDKKRRKLKAEYVWNGEQMQAVDTEKVDYLLGLFEYSHMGFAADREPGPTADPTLEEMTVTALNILEKSPKGFFLVVEGGRIDHAHHFNNPYRALDETLQLEAAVRAAVSRADLLLVTADHGHVMTVGGHGAPREHPILGTDAKLSDVDSLPYTSILYGSGPGYGARPSPDPEEPHADRDRVHAAAAPKQWATHGAEDVPVYAMGPLATVLFSGTFEQSYIPHAVAFIACLGEQAARCEEQQNLTQTQVSSSCPEAPNVNLPVGASVSHDPLTPGVVQVASSVMADDSDRRTAASSTSHLAISYIPMILTLILKDIILDVSGS